MRRQCNDGDGKESDEMEEGETLDTAEAGISSAAAASAAPPRGIEPEHGTAYNTISQGRGGRKMMGTESQFGIIYEFVGSSILLN